MTYLSKGIFTYTGMDRLLRRLSRCGRANKQILSMLADGLCVFAALWLAHSLRLGELYTGGSAGLPVFVGISLITVLIFHCLGIYRWMVRSGNIGLLFQLAVGCALSALLVGLVSLFPPPDRIYPRSLFLIYGLLLLAATCSIRMLWQMLFRRSLRGERVAIYGAGSAGRQLVRLLAVGREYRPVVFIDDNQAHRRTTVAGLPVLDGQANDLGQRLQERGVKGVILALPSVSSDEYQMQLRKLEKLGLSVQTIPSVSDVITGRAKLHEVRDVSISDILGRSEVAPDMDLMGRCVRGRSVMVTGGGGSIGSELCRQILRLNPTRLVLVDHSEANLYQITEELNRVVRSMAGTCQSAIAPAFHPVLCSVTDRAAIDRLMQEHAIETVYHAAAYKHVPIVEAQPEQGVFVNVFGTLTVLESAIAHRVANFTLISTDKAVRPANAMGASKRIAELVLQAKSNQPGATCISMVRFGNVLGSSGSVVPKFMKQIREGGPITLTHADITRYFMTIPEASQLVLQSSAIAQGGDVFVLDMGEPVRIQDLAMTMVRLCGRKLRADTGDARDIDIVIEGLRPGEKMYEELFLSNGQAASSVPKVFTAQEAWLPWTELSVALQELQRLAGVADREGMRELMFSLARVGEPVAVVDGEPVPAGAGMARTMARPATATMDAASAQAMDGRKSARYRRPELDAVTG